MPRIDFESLLKAEIIKSCGHDQFRSDVRISNFYLPNVPDRHVETVPFYYVHSAFPAASDAVFFGPDTYLFITFLQNIAHHFPDELNFVVDVCCGSGAGAIHMWRTHPEAKVCGLDLNPAALKLGYINAQIAGAEVSFYESNLFASIPQDSKSEGVDLIVSNPPYIASSTDGQDLPIYADGGAGFGLDISFRIVELGVKLLSSRGLIVLYTGVAIPVSEPGYDPLLNMLKKVPSVELVEYTVLHPDMWSEEIGKGAYAEVGRIQVIGAVLKKK